MSVQVATSQHELVHRLLDRKTEPLVIISLTLLTPLVASYVYAVNMCCQDKLILRVKTANDEVGYLQDFEYGESKLSNSQLKLVQKVPVVLRYSWCNALRSCHKWARAA